MVEVEKGGQIYGVLEPGSAELGWSRGNDSH
jgi:hypothetical protein